MEEKFIRKVSKNEWIDIYRVMKQYNRYEGYINDLDGKLTLFDSNVCLDDSWGFHITIEQVENLVNKW